MNLPIHSSTFPVRLRFPRPLTDRQLMRFSEENRPWRVERNAKGEIEIMSPSGIEGGMVEANVVLWLGLWTREDGRGLLVGPSGGFTLPDTSVRAADAAWISRDRLNTVTAEQRAGYAPVVPEFIIEVRSERDRLKPLQRKMLKWITNGVELGWLVDPRRKVVEVYRLNREPEVYENPTSLQGTGPVAGFELVFDKVWA